jgi:spore coat protein CotH
MNATARGAQGKAEFFDARMYMFHDPSQMREALAWRRFRRAGVPAPRHTYARLAFDDAYRGLFSVIEQVDKRFLKDHFGGNARRSTGSCTTSGCGGTARGSSSTS